ncbi:MAG: glycosyltransferase family 39 protein [Deltaproteobacteria bacterium]|nr:glycosyltransferase family 39 protein [Deltaproteobacteria bacterium]MBF0507687.1 glycosyltransferase family 39 protein [Deltaproteobacteria bacterium]
MWYKQNIKSISSSLENSDTAFFWAMVVITLYAFTLRILGVTDGLPYLYWRHWDEPQIASAALRILKTGDLNPHFFNYPSFMIYACLLVDVLHYYFLMGKEGIDGLYIGLRSIDEILINIDTGWNWTISHPSFYLWNRALTVLMGTISVPVVGLIALKAYGKWVAILASLILSGLAFHIYHSIRITTDLPFSFFVLLVVLFSLRFHYTQELKYLILALVCVGLATATKYNAVISIIVPTLAFIINVRKISFSRLLGMLSLFLVPPMVFLCINPYAVLDLRAFLLQSGYEVRHYMVAGHGANTVEPGMNHFMLPMNRIASQIDSFHYYCFVGILVAIWRNGYSAIIILLFPVVYLTFISQSRVGFHRNFLVIYPFCAIFAAVGIHFVLLLFRKLVFYLKIKKRLVRNLIYSLPIIMLAGYFGFLWYSRLCDALYSGRPFDNRTLAVEYINKKTKNWSGKRIGIAAELMIHQIDLSKLKVPYEIFNHKDIQQALDRFDFVLVGEYADSHKGLPDAPNKTEEANLLNAMTPKEPSDKVISGNQASLTCCPIDSPKIIVIKGRRK